MPFQIVRNDITKMKTDVIVNAANTQLKYGSGVCGAIFNAAGKDRLIAECEKIGHCDIGSAVVTSGFDLCEYIIHTVGPVWKGGFFGEKAKLESCYKNVLKFAYELNAENIAIPLISSGVFGYPKDKAMKVAVETIVSSEYLAEMDIYLVVFDKNAVVFAIRQDGDIKPYSRFDCTQEENKEILQCRLGKIISDKSI